MFLKVTLHIGAEIYNQFKIDHMCMQEYYVEIYFHTLERVMLHNFLCTYVQGNYIV